MPKPLMNKCKSAKMSIRSAVEVEINIIYVQRYGPSFKGNDYKGRIWNLNSCLFSFVCYKRFFDPCKLKKPICCTELKNIFNE